MVSLRGIRLPPGRLRPSGRLGQSNSSKPRAGVFSALRYRNYRLFWAGQLVSVTGTFMQGVAQQWLVLTLTSNPIALGIVGALQFGPVLVPFGGAIADRWPRRNVLVATQTSAGLLAIVLWALTATHAVQLWHVFVLSLLLGVVNAVDMPTRQAFVSEMVPPESLLNAVSLNSAQFNASRILGPGLAGALIAIFGTSLLFLLNGISYLAVIAGLLLMRSRELVAVQHSEAAPRRGHLQAMGDGARFVLANPAMRVTFLMIAVIGTLGFNFNVLMPLETKGVLRAGPEVFGLLSSALGVGALVGALLLARRAGAPSNRLLIGMAFAFGLLEASIALTRSVPVALVLMAATGFAMSSFSASANTRVQLASPPAMRGRVMSVYTMVFVGTTPIGNLLVSAIAGSGGVPMAFAVSGLPCLVVALVAAWLWQHQKPAPSASAHASMHPAERADVAAPAGALGAGDPSLEPISDLPETLLQHPEAPQTAPARS